MQKEILTVEFRYHENHWVNPTHKVLTIGIFDTLEEAIVKGNEAITVLSQKFTFNKEDKFSLNGFLGLPEKLVMSHSPFEVYVQIQTLHLDNLVEVMNYVIEAEKKSKNSL
jgi:hypothetical protein